MDNLQKNCSCKNKTQKKTEKKLMSVAGTFMYLGDEILYDFLLIFLLILRKKLKILYAPKKTYNKTTKFNYEFTIHLLRFFNL
jgi:hypothetical protein